MDQIWILNIFLNDASFILFGSNVELARNMLLYFLQIVKDLDPVTSISIFSWFDDPPGVFRMTF